ncbi:MAG: type II toxin-antitoxin system RelE/ParE family toxin [Bauldia sp.]
MTLKWSSRSLRDLQRFAEFLQPEHPELATRIADEIVGRMSTLADFPRLGPRIAGRDRHRSIAIDVLGAAYVVQYEIEGGTILVLRVFHAREHRPIE